MTTSLQLVALLVASVFIFQTVAQSPVCEGNCGNHFGQVEGGCLNSGPSCKCKRNGKAANEKFCDQNEATAATTCSCSEQQSETPAPLVVESSTFDLGCLLGNESTPGCLLNATVVPELSSSAPANETEVSSLLIETLEKCVEDKKTEFGDLSDQECADLEELIVELKEVVECPCTIKEKEKKAGRKMNKFFKNKKSISKKVKHVQIPGYGYVEDYCSNSELEQIRGTDELTAYNSTTDSYPLVDAFEEAASESSDSGFVQVCEKISFRVSYILSLPDWSKDQKTGACKKVIDNAISEHPEQEANVKNVTLKVGEEEFGNVEDFEDACEAVEQTRSLKEVVGGPSSECKLIKALRALYQTCSCSTTQKSQIKQLADKLESKFNATENIETRVVTTRDECFQLYLLVPSVKPIVDSAECEKADGSVWGSVNKITTIANWQESFGCGDLSEGPGVLPSCGDRVRTIEVNQTTNSTIFESSLETCVATFTSTAKLQYSSTRNSIKACIRSPQYASAPGLKLKCISDVILKTYSTNNAVQKKKLTDCPVKSWYKDFFFSFTSLTQSFCDCGSKV